MVPSSQSLQLFGDPLLRSGRFLFVNYSRSDLVALDFDLKPDAFPNPFGKGFTKDDHLSVFFSYGKNGLGAFKPVNYCFCHHHCTVNGIV